MHENLDFINQENKDRKIEAEINKFWRDKNFKITLDGKELTLKEAYLEAVKRAKEVFSKTQKILEQEIPQDKFILYINQTENGMMQNPNIKYVDKDRLELINEAETGERTLMENYQVANIRYCLGMDKDDKRFKVFNSYQDDPSTLDLNSCVGVIFSGGEAYIKDEMNEDRKNMIQTSKQIVEKTKNLKLPRLGICFGAQLLADNSGGKVDWVYEEDHNKRITGPENIKPTNEEVLPKDLTIAENHAQDIHLGNLQAEVLALNENGALEVFQFENTLCTQGHPEVGSNRLDLGLDLNKKEESKQKIFESNIEKTREYFFIKFIKNAGEYNKNR
ncbi:MAG: gamma-glutamyl-gamma-aminobutyrate hydrolase family protein [Candidatus Pacebacteria bacterium]|nr:gamma-glutamyl-gamma-aminobutyrate hydrolase family protein [Candidatus Paceibacterota bacterium]